MHICIYYVNSYFATAIMAVPEDNDIDVSIEEPLGDINRMYVHINLKHNICF